MQTLFAGTKAQFLVTGVDGHVYGLVAAYSDQADLGHCYIAFLRCSQRRSNGEMYEGMFLFVEYLFSTTPYRKLYAEVPEYNDSVMGLSRFGPFKEEGRLLEHDFHDNRWWDRLLLAVYRDTWDTGPLRSDRSCRQRDLGRTLNGTTWVSADLTPTSHDRERSSFRRSSNALLHAGQGDSQRVAPTCSEDLVMSDPSVAFKMKNDQKKRAMRSRPLDAASNEASNAAIEAVAGE